MGKRGNILGRVGEVNKESFAGTAALCRRSDLHRKACHGTYYGATGARGLADSTEGLFGWLELKVNYHINISSNVRSTKAM
jgi:hypothetical protein